MTAPDDVRREAGADGGSLARSVLLLEVLLVLSVSLGRSAVYSLVSLIEAYTQPGGLSEQSAVLNPSLATEPWIDLTRQVLVSTFRVMPALLACYLLYRTGHQVRAIMVGHEGRLRDLVRGAALAAGVGTVGVAFYVLTRELGIQLGISRRGGILISALLRGSYHLYQGIGGFLGNAAMGLLFGWLYTRWGRVAPFVITHTLLDIGAFVGYALLADRVGFL